MFQELLQTNLCDLRKDCLKKIHVAVLDTGIDASHDVLRGRVVKAIGFNKDEDGNIAAFKMSRNANNDSTGHGTAAASIIAALAPNTVFTDYRVLDGSNTGMGKVVLYALQMAIESDADIINLSLTVTKSTYWDEMVKLLEEAYLKRKIVVAAKRNIPQPQDLGLPAELSSCISVDNKYLKNPFVFHFLENSPIEFAANGMGVMAAKNGGGYHRVTGTSFSTPTITSMCALLLGKAPGLYLFEIKSILKHQQKKKVPGTVNPLEFMPVRASRRFFSIAQYCSKCKEKFYTNDLYPVYLCPHCGTTGKRHPLLSMELYEFAMTVLIRTLPAKYVFHSVTHTIDVVSAVYEILSKTSGLTRHKQKTLLTAALLHDFGYIDSPEDHEKASMEIARRMLGDFGWKQEDAAEVSTLIEATRPDHKAVTRSEKIIRDADLYHIGTDNYLKKSLLLRKELQNLGTKISLQQWYRDEIGFLSNHSFELYFLERERKTRKREIIKHIKAKLKST